MAMQYALVLNPETPIDLRQDPCQLGARFTVVDEDGEFVVNFELEKDHDCS